MAIAFTEETHKYESIDPRENIAWVSVTSIVGMYKQPFNGKEISERVAKSKKSKWFGMTPELIQATWKKEADRACDLGTWYHKQREDDLLSCDTINRYGADLRVFPPLMDTNGRKISPDQRLQEGIYPEHMVYLNSAGICGQSDLVEVVNGKVNITDYKTNKEIKTSSFKNWEGVSQRMAPPLTHLDDCNLNHYNMQLSLYMYVILKHNPRLQPGELVIHHITFEEQEEKDQYGFPLVVHDVDGNPIVKEVVIYRLPYLKDEVVSMLKHFEDNRAVMLARKK